MTAEIEIADVASIVQDIFSTMMDLSVCKVEGPITPPGDRLTSSVYLEGSWKGAVSVECSRQQACDFAGRFLASDPPPAVDDDVRDVMGEIVNMIGGNFKASLGSDVRLSVPSVIDGSDYEIRICGSATCNKVAFRYEGGDFLVTVLTNHGVRPARSGAASRCDTN